MWVEGGRGKKRGVGPGSVGVLKLHLLLFLLLPLTSSPSVDVILLFVGLEGARPFTARSGVFGLLTSSLCWRGYTFCVTISRRLSFLYLRVTHSAPGGLTFPT